MTSLSVMSLITTTLCSFDISDAQTNSRPLGLQKNHWRRQGKEVGPRPRGLETESRTEVPKLVPGPQSHMGCLPPSPAPMANLHKLKYRPTAYWVHHAIPTDSVPTDAIPTVHSRDVGY